MAASPSCPIFPSRCSRAVCRWRGCWASTPSPTARTKAPKRTRQAAPRPRQRPPRQARNPNNMLKRRFLLAAALVALPLAGCGVFKGGGGPKTPTVGDRVSILSNDASIKCDPALAETAVVLPAAVPHADRAQPGGQPEESQGHLALAPARTSGEA